METSSDLEESLLSKDGDVNNNDDVSTTTAYKRRWYILAVFSLNSCHQCTLWNTYGPIARSVRYAYPNWTDSTIAMMANWEKIMFCIFCVPICWMLDRMGLRPTVLLSIGSGLMALGSILRIFSTLPDANLILAHFGSILIGISCVAFMAAPTALSAAWFPPKERTTATAISQFANSFGNCVSFFLGPLMVQDIPLYRSNEQNLPSREEMRINIWWYLVVLASTSTVLFLLLAVYFPSKPKRPPSKSAAFSTEDRPKFGTSVKLLLTSRNAMLCMIALSLSCGVFGAWAAVMTINFEALGVRNSQSSKIGALMEIVTFIVGMGIARFTDKYQEHFKLIVLAIGTVSTTCFVWLTLLVLKVIPLQMWQLYVSVLLGGSVLYSCEPVISEYANEMMYPVSEGIIGGFFAFGYNMVGMFFYLLFFIPNIGNVWMNYAIAGSAFSIIPLICLTNGKLNRMQLDEDTEAEYSQIHQ